MSSAPNPGKRAETILEMGCAHYGFAVNEKTRGGAEEMAGALAQLAAAPVGDGEEPFMPPAGDLERD